MNNNIGKAVLAGFFATVVLSLLMIAKAMMGLMPGLNVIKMLGSITGGGPVVGWLTHFGIGTIAWGAGFALSYDIIPGSAPWQKGIVFASGAWVLMMLIVMPLAGAGLFGLRLGLMAAVMTLVLHIIFGAVLGAGYGRFVAGR